ncbi:MULTISPECIES: hypothetical protein [unclassified Rhizobium]|uniref:hypothetical protein n=1 Tax=unclassified Rhizobium TaxID=2613769 RepID=UPI001ADB443E|nr:MULTISPECIES: hypothetical protein [unclassified Rhizobium]MBO9101721.1 hypothetical protein [Rhizobium sp. L58/93]QXZ87157.1 hypothetical protein J5287_21535 [Rhizobium sp. K1/93]QXZ92810.1 hypothetical protein J5280_19360 [Rhizobium sp. K15/93]
MVSAAAKGIVICKIGGPARNKRKGRKTVTKDTMIGVDLAKAVFQLHAASMIGQPKFRKKRSQQGFSEFAVEHPPAPS